MPNNAISSTSFIIIFAVFSLLFVDLIGTNLELSKLKDSEDFTEVENLKNKYNTKLKYTVATITLVLLYYIANSIAFILGQNLK